MGCSNSKDSQVVSPTASSPSAGNEKKKSDAEPKVKKKEEKTQEQPRGSKDKKGRGSNAIVTILDPSVVTPRAITDVYEVGVELGRGTFSVVKQGLHKETEKSYALKFIEKKYLEPDDLQNLPREIEIMKKVNHKNVLSLKEIFETEKQLCLVTELLEGGELFFQIVNRESSYSENDASDIIRQIVLGVEYLHSLGIAHRDLKPENLLCSNDEPMVIKIADFGLSKMFAGGQQLKTSCGTPDYAAPEVLSGGDNPYDKSVDLWSVGVVSYVVLCGYPPFYAASQPALFEKIIHADYDFPEAEWDLISSDAKNFVKNLLEIQPGKRLTATQCLEHPFLALKSEPQPEAETVTQLDIGTSMSKYAQQRKKELGKIIEIKE